VSEKEQTQVAEETTKEEDTAPVAHGGFFENLFNAIKSLFTNGSTAEVTETATNQTEDKPITETTEQAQTPSLAQTQAPSQVQNPSPVQTQVAPVSAPRKVTDDDTTLLFSDLDEGSKVAKNHQAPTPPPLTQSHPAIEQTRVNPQEKRSAYYPDTSYKAPYKNLQETPDATKASPIRQKAKKTPKTPAKTKQAKETTAQKMVITKTIDNAKEKAKPQASDDPFAGRVLGPMSDRVLGGGVDSTRQTGKLGMRVTKNSKPIAAWVEVFKNGTKTRVKTFYTSKTKRIKNVRLPTGTYMVRVSHRTRGAKEQKTIKGIALKDGAVINKSVSFSDGKLKVIARKSGNPAYVRVVIYKKGTHKKISYAFSSRTSGIAVISLANGTYDIEVQDHANVRSFSSVRIKEAKTNTIHVDF